MGAAEALFGLIANLGIGFEELLLLLTVLGNIIFASRDLKIMFVMGFILSFFWFVVFYEWGLRTQSALYLGFGYLILMVLSFFTSAKKVNII